MKNVTDKAIIDYLLGKTDLEDDFLAVCFSSDENAEKYESVLDELIESYLRGELSKEDEKRFKNYFLNDPYHREKFVFSSALLKNLSENKETIQAAAIQKNEKKSRLNGSWLYPAFAFGTLFLVGIIGIGFLVQYNETNLAKITPTPTPIVKPNPQSLPNEMESSTPEANSLPAVAPSSMPTSQNNSTPKPTATPQPTPDNPKTIEKSNSILAFALPLGAKGGAEDDLVIGNQIKTVLLWTIPPEEKFSQYKVSIKHNNQILWTKSYEKLPLSGKGRLRINVPAEIFKTGRHKFLISGVKENGITEDLFATESIFFVRRETNNEVKKSS